MAAPKRAGVRKGQVSREILLFDIDDTFHLSPTRTEAARPSSIEAQPSTSHPDWNICMARLGTAPSRSPTPDIDVVHPAPPRETTLLDTKSGFFLSNNTYISHWECCQCHKIHPITDKNKKWHSRKASLLREPRDADMFYSEKCTKLDCLGVRCDTCFDLDLVGYRRQYCNNAPCEWKKTPQWLHLAVDDSNLLKPCKEQSKPSSFGREISRVEDFPVTPKKIFPLRPW